MLVRNSLPLLHSSGNEYAQSVHVQLPDGQRAVINNVYLPPVDSLRRRNVLEATAREEISKVVSAAPAAHQVLTCGDFNVRTGTRAPVVRGTQLARQSMDQHVCNRANWFVQFCELAELHILNGAAPQEPAPPTCYTHRGRSTVDYILSQDPGHVIEYDKRVLHGFSDHVLLHFALPVAVLPPPVWGTPAATPSAKTYRWDVGASIPD